MTLDEFLKSWNDEDSYVEVMTSGSTGTPKRMKAEKERMRASARITCSFLGLDSSDSALLCLPLDYIAGKMMVVRALEVGMKLISAVPSGHPLASLLNSQNPTTKEQKNIPTFAAMVPSQVYNSLRVPEERELFSKIDNVIIGGGAIDAELEKELRDFPNAIWSTYGMTETLSHIALRRLSGPNAEGWYEPFDGVHLSATSDGCLVICAPAVAEHDLVTHDIVQFESCDGLKPASRRFKILGRKDNVIDSGGIKLQIEEIENKLAPEMHKIGVQFLISKRPDPKFGEIVVMLYEMPAKYEISVKGDDSAKGDESARVEEIQKRLQEISEKTLPKYWRPRAYVAVDKIPKTQTDKPDRARALAAASI